MTDYQHQVMELANRSQNKSCIDCGSHTPQWASVTFGIYFCLECSGIHRSLGVHITFVRSVTMDKWSEIQAKRMTLGGNDNAIKFFTSHPEYKDGMSIPDKYQSEFALMYKEKLTALCENREWTMPAIGSVKSKIKSPGSDTTFKHTLASTRATPRTKLENEQYFASKGLVNESRSDQKAPFEGGKYTGFGSTKIDSPVKENILDNPIASISKGWGMFSSLAIQGLGNIGQTVTDKVIQIINEVIKPTTTAIRDPDFNKNMTNYVGQMTQKASEIGSNGLQYASKAANHGFDIVNNAVTTVASGNIYSSIAMKDVDSKDFDSSVVGTPDLEWDDWMDPKYKDGNTPIHTPSEGAVNESAVEFVASIKPKDNEEWNDF